MNDDDPKQGPSDFGPDEILDRIIPDPANPDVKRLTGFLMGKSDNDDYWRLYLTVNLNHYIEFRKQDTLYAHQFRPARTMVWIKADAKVREVRSGPIEFVTGDMVREYLHRHGGNFTGLFGSPIRLMAADGSGCAHAGCSVNCTPGYGCGGGDTVGYTCGC